MNRQTKGLLLKALAALALTTSALASRCVHAESPLANDSGGTTYTLTDDDARTPSGIVWGAASENYRACDFARAGYPQCQRKIAIPSNNRFYGGYYVGGGTPARGAGRCPDEGTWGWDYASVLFTKKIALNWTAKSRSQGGTGAYKTDGPKLRHE